MKSKDFYDIIDAIHYAVSQLNKLEKEQWREYDKTS